MREVKAFRIDPSVLPVARKRAGLPEGTPDGVVVRVALALMAGLPITDEVTDTTGGAGSLARRAKRAARQAAEGTRAA